MSLIISAILIQFDTFDFGLWWIDRQTEL